MAMALRPSISGRYFGEGEDNGPGIAADRGQRRQAAAPPSLAGLCQTAISHRTISHRNDGQKSALRNAEPALESRFSAVPELVIGDLEKG
jgi:hypothetical protein